MECSVGRLVLDCYHSRVWVVLDNFAWDESAVANESVVDEVWV